ncbi:hypothetical protein HPB52_014087 [Rhipicephalus sanguineus]|uniref:Uncharacterized protein n=1 Tax=Rhipicephalus sanguineus TaxID=34632 RepID=A0A9D4YPQ5_RHISA|nr:hypothetical protein HPB52_014087 [Rhipicephalus sanguineus]
MVTSCLRSVIREEAQALRLEFFRQTGITAGAGDMRSKKMDDNADLRLVEDALVSYADQWADGVTDCFTAAVFKYRCSCSATRERLCHIVRHLAALNELLFCVKM